MSLKQCFKNAFKDATDPDEKYEKADVKFLKIPAPEKLIPDIDYAFTYSPLTDCYNALEPKYQRDFIKEHKTNFDNCFSCDIFVSTEFSVKGAFHFHGIIRIHKGKEHLFYLKDVRRLCSYGNMCIESITDREEWDKYCKKNRHLMEQLQWPEIDIYNRKQKNLLYKEIKDRLKKELKANARSAMNKVNTNEEKESEDSTFGDECDEPVEITNARNGDHSGLFEEFQAIYVGIHNDLEFGLDKL